LVDGE